MNRSERNKVRQTPEWKDLRETIKNKQDGLDPITKKKLMKGFNLHHLDLDHDSYADLSEEKFAALNRQTHEFVHWIWRYYSKDEAVIERLLSLLQKMKEFNLVKKHP